MTTKKGKIKSWRMDSKPEHRMIERAVIVRLTNSDPAQVATFDAVIASENPVERWDDQRKEVVQEILLTSGLEFRDGRNQLPIVDSHDRGTVRNVLGSIRNIQVQGDEVVGQPSFARDVDSQDAYHKVIDGHITDFSITADPLEIVEVARGQSAQFGERVITGPANVVTRWQPTDASLVAAGADVRSKVRRSYELSKGIARAMTPEAIAKLVEKGMPSDLTDPEQIMAWVLGNLSASEQHEVGAAPVAPVESAEMPVETEEEKPVEEVANMDGEEPEEEVENGYDEKQMSRSLDTKKVTLAERKRIAEINALASKARIERTVADSWINSGVSLDVVREKVIERMAANATPSGSSVGADVRVTQSADDKLIAAVSDGLLLRSKSSARVNRIFADDRKPAEGARDFANLSLLRAASAYLRAFGADTDRATSSTIARAALGNKSALRSLGIQRAEAYHTTGSFANLLLDASNKTLLAAYEEAPYTWNIWARQGASVDDFKNIHRMRFSEFPDLEAVPETQPYKDKAMSDSKESYKVEKYGALFSISWETVVNDDLDAISRTPAMMGNAARRLQNKKVYEVLTSNPLMGDGQALFSASHPSGSNVSGGAGNPAVGTLNTMFQRMMLQKGLSSDTVLGIVPRYVIVPVALSATLLELFSSISYNAANNNEGVRNIYGPSGERALTPVIEPVLDGASSSVWYAAADPSQIDTVELTFLSGEESPVVENEWDFETDTYKNKIRQTFGVKAIDWRGLFRNSA